MFCPKCGTQLPDGASFCTSCGARLNKNDNVFCANCGVQLPEGAVFCASCGTPANGATQPTSYTAPANNIVYATQQPQYAGVVTDTNVSVVTPAGKLLYRNYISKQDWFPADAVDDVLEKMKTVDKKTANKINECGLSSPSTVLTMSWINPIVSVFLFGIIGGVLFSIGTPRYVARAIAMLPAIFCSMYIKNKCNKKFVWVWNLKDAVRQYNLEKFEKATNSNCEKRNEVTSSKTAPNQGNSGGVFYAFVGSTKTGPLKDTDIVSLAAEGKINNQTLMWKKGMKAWAQASAIPEVNKILLSQSEATYYVYLDNNKVGPMSITDIESLIKSGKINSQTLVWKNGLKNWTYASNVPEINKIR